MLVVSRGQFSHLCTRFNSLQDVSASSHFVLTTQMHKMLLHVSFCALVDLPAVMASIYFMFPPQSVLHVAIVKVIAQTVSIPKISYDVYERAHRGSLTLERCFVEPHCGTMDTTTSFL